MAEEELRPEQLTVREGWRDCDILGGSELHTLIELTIDSTFGHDYDL